MKKIFTLMTLLVAIVTGAQAEVETLFDAASSSWSKYGNYATANVTYGDVTWHFGGSASYASGSYTFSDTKKWDGRLKLGGKSTFKSGSTLARVLTFTPSQAGTVKVYCVHGSDSGTRTTYISQSITSTDRDVTTALGSYAATAEAKNGIAVAEVEADKMVYVWADNNVGIYAITFEAAAPVTKYDVTYKANGSGEEDVVNNVSKVDDNMFTWAGHTFTGWNTAANGLGTAYAAGDAVTSELELYAQWVASYAISKTTPANGTITVSAENAAAGDAITLTATPEFRYKLDAWDVYKTGEPSTKVTVTDNAFTMPAYAVTVDASFSADTRKQVLYVTSDGSVNENDKLFSALSEDYTLTKAAYNASKTVTDFDLVVLHESIGGSNYNTGLVKAAKEANVPLLNTKSYFYNDGRWGWGTPNAGQSVDGATLSSVYTNIASHPIFNEVTVSEGFVTLFSSAQAKAMQPLGSLVDGKEGYILAITPNNGTGAGNGAAIHELTPAQRGVASAKYLMISIGNENGCFEKLTANGQKLIKNAAAYLMGATAWTPTYATVDVTTNAGKWASFTPSFNCTLADGATAYLVTGVDAEQDKVTINSVTTLKAGQGYFVKGEAASTAYTATATDLNADATTGNMLVGCTTATEIAAGTKPYAYVLGTDGSTPGLYYVGENAITVPAGKCYLNSGVTDGDAPLSLSFEYGNVTAVQNVVAAPQANEAQVGKKAFVNGQLVIITENGMVNALGQAVK